MVAESQGGMVAQKEGSALSLKEHLYLFDIVASLCAGLNEHDIQFLSSLLAFLSGDLSTRAKAERNEDRERTHRGTKEKKRSMRDDRKQREREKEREGEVRITQKMC